VAKEELARAEGKVINTAKTKEGQGLDGR